ncbi:MAG: toll/interleukin-1 receptor domain-containing protein, partial [Colwellia sp.]|nr:toll/interleukin-1 receptor domain-containing protein [Colwellia sp.]
MQHKKDFNSITLLLASGINSDNLELVIKRTHSHVYYDHVHKLKIGVSCLYDGGALNISISKKYYGQ